MANLSPDISPEATTVIRAQQIVDRWRRSSDRSSFEIALRVALIQPWDDFMNLNHHRQAVRRVAEAIYGGKGHAFYDREPLLKIARRVIHDT